MAAVAVAPAASASGSAPAPALTAPVGEGLCPGLCALEPTYASQQSVPLRLSFRTADGASHDDASLRDKVVVFHLWQRPLPEVMEDLPQVAKLASSLKDLPDVVFFTASIDEDPVRAREAYRQLLDDRPFPLVVGEDASSLMLALGPERLPAVIVLDARRTVRARFEGTRRWKLPTARGFFEGLSVWQGCSVEVLGGKVTAGGCGG